MKKISILIIIILELVINLNAKTQNKYERYDVIISYNDIFSSLLESYVKIISKKVSLDKDVLIFCKNYLYKFDTTSVAFIYYTSEDGKLCDILFIKDCISINEEEILIDSNHKFTMPKDNKIWFTYDEDSPFPNAPIIEFDYKTTSTIFFSKSKWRYFTYGESYKNKNDSIQNLRREYSNYINKISDEIWFAFCNNKFSIKDFKDK